MLALVVLIERALLRFEPSFWPLEHANYSYPGERYRQEAQCDFLCFGDSLVKQGVAAQVGLRRVRVRAEGGDCVHRRQEGVLHERRRNGGRPLPAGGARGVLSDRRLRRLLLRRLDDRLDHERVWLGVDDDGALTGGVRMTIALP